MVKAKPAKTIVKAFPKTSLFPAFVAGFFLVLSMHRPGMVNFPTLLTCVEATLAKESSIVVTVFFFISHSVAMASAMAPLLIAFTPFAFICGAIADKREPTKGQEEATLKGRDT